MATIRNNRSGFQQALECEHLVGRSPRCALQLSHGLISAQHASLRWTKSGWELKDLGSLNGTFMDGKLLDKGQGYPIASGSRIAFGDAGDEWELCDDTPPRVMVVPSDGGEPILVEGELTGIPSNEDPQATLLRRQDGQWWLERADSPLTPAADQQVFQVGSRSWRFCCPALIAATSLSEDFPSVSAISLQFLVSRDEEHVELRVSNGARTRTLGSRGHNYLLLTLARLRLSDSEQGFGDTTCGWTDQAELLRGMATNPGQLNIDIFRIRKQFTGLGLCDGGNIIERRPRAKQLRIGVRKIAITHL